VAADLQQRARGANLDATGERGFGAVARGHDQPTSHIARGQRRRKDAIDRAQFASQAEFAEELAIAQRLQRNLPARGKDPQCDGQVETAAVLGQVGGGEVDGDAPRREFELRAEDRGADAILRFAHRGFGQADDGHRRQSARQMHFDAYRRRTDARPCTAVHE